MRMLWPSEQLDPGTLSKLTRLGLASACYTRSLAHTQRCKLPIFLNNNHALVREPHDFLYDKYFFSRSARPGKTINTYAECLLAWFSYVESANEDWRNANVVDIVEYRNFMRTNGAAKNNKTLSVSTINLRIIVVAEFYKFFWRQEILFNPQSSVFVKEKLSKLISVKLRLRQSRRIPKALTPSACTTLVNALNDGPRLILKWALSTGLRTSSILSIDVETLMRLSKLHVGQFIEVNVKGGKQQQVYVPSQILRDTNDYIETTRRLIEKKGNFSQKVFLNKRGTAMTSQCYYASYKRACNRIGLISHPHQARTTFATYMQRRIKAGSDKLGIDSIKVIQGLLGHASSQTTEVYLETICVNNPDVLEMLELNSSSWR
jgi:site-specific recombinase XerD